MIANERQHRISKTAIKRFEDAIARAEADGPRDGVHPRLHAAMIDGLRSQHDELRGELRAYDALREGKVKRRVLHSLAEIPGALIEGRIAARLTQRELADRLGVSEQHIQRYEQTLYSGANIERLQEVAAALKLTVRKTIDFHIPTGATLKSSGGSRRRRKTPSGGVAMANRRTGKAAGSAAGKILSSKSASKAAQEDRHPRCDRRLENTASQGLEQGRQGRSGVRPLAGGAQQETLDPTLSGSRASHAFLPKGPGVSTIIGIPQLRSRFFPRLIEGGAELF